MALEIRLLGPLQVIADGRPLRVGRERERVLLALLAARSPAQVPSDQLVQELWGESPPGGARTTLRAYVSSLRRALRVHGHEHAIVTGRQGYALSDDPAVTVDTTRFRELVGAAEALRGTDDRAGEAAALHDALALWRGRALDPLDAIPELASAARSLEDERLVALERWSECRLVLGHHGEVAAALAAECDLNPTRERLWAHRMRALYASGRQAEALRCYRELYRRLDEELGVAPGTELRELELAILRHDPRLRPGPAGLPGALRTVAGSVFVGRTRELEALSASSAVARAGSGRLTAVHGEPGAGKTRLLAEWASRREAHSVTVLYGRCDSGDTIPYQPFVEALGHLRTADGRIHPGVDALLTGGVAAAAAELEVARWRWFDALTELLLAVAADAPLALALDDLHWADESSLRLLRHLAARAGRSALAIVVSYRSAARAPPGPLAQALAGLETDPGLDELELGGLNEAEVAELVGRSLAEAPAELASELHRLTDGNPLFVRQLLARLERSGARALAPGEDRPAGVAEVIESRLALLGGDAIEILTVAALLGDEFDVTTLEAAHGGPSEAVIGAIEVALAARVLTVVDEDRERYRFGHDLLREGLRATVAGPRRARRHQQIAEALELLPDGDGQRLGAIAGHFAAAARPGYVEPAARYAERAGRHALSQLAFEQAAAIAERGLSCLALDADGPSEQRCDLELLLAEARLLARDIGACKEAAVRAGEDARALGSAQRLARAAIIGSHLSRFGQPSPPTRALCADALKAIGDADPVAQALVLAGFSDYVAVAEGDAPRAARLSARAVQAARRSGDHRALARALFVHGEALEWGPQLQRRRALAAELRRLAIRHGDPQAETDAHHLSALAALEAGDLPGFDSDVARIAALRERTGYWYTEMFALLWRGMRALLAGRLPEAEADAEALLGYAGHEPNVVNLYMGQLLSIRRDQERLPELREPLLAVVDANPGIIAFRCVLALVLAEHGEDEAAREQLSALAGDGFASLARDSTWSTSLAVLSDAAVLVGDRRSAELLGELLAPHAGRLLIATKGIACLGAADRFIGELSSLCGRPREAGRALAAAAELERRIGATLLLARTERAQERLRRAGTRSARRHSALSSHQ